MKKIFITTAILMVIHLGISAQVFIGWAIADKGFTMQTGYRYDNGAQIFIGFKTPVMNTSKEDTGNANEFLYFISAGKEIYLSNYDEGNNYTITPSIGLANSEFKERDFDLKCLYGLEVGKHTNLGRFFLAANYSKQFYYSAGIKFFFD